MSSLIKAGYLGQNLRSEFRDNEWLVNNSSVDVQVKLVQYPCYTLKSSDLGSYVFVIGDTQYNYVDETVKSQSKMQYDFLDLDDYNNQNLEILNSIWLIGYLDTYYLAVSGTFNGLLVNNIIPLAFNATDMQLNMREMHIYLDIIFR